MTLDMTLDMNHLQSLGERKAELMSSFLETTKAAVALDIGSRDDSVLAEFIRLVTLRESIISEVDDIDRELMLFDSGEHHLDLKERSMFFEFLQRAGDCAAEALTLTRDLEGSLAMVNRSLRLEGARAGTSLHGRASYGDGNEREEQPRFLDTRL